MSLPFEATGVLIPGVHDASIAEIKAVFAGPSSSVRRIELFRQLLQFRGELSSFPWACTIVIDGSFVMLPVQDPDDLDLILVVPAAANVNALGMNQRHLLSRRRVRLRFDIDLAVAREGSAIEGQWLAVFGQVNEKWCGEFGWPATMRKGIVRIQP